MGTVIPVTKNWCKENAELVIYNYFAEKCVVTKEQTQKELQEKFDISLTKEQIDKIFKNYVQRGILSHRLSSYQYKQ